MRRAPDEIRVPDLGLLQWWAEAPDVRQHWYVSEEQRAYRVTVEDGRPGSIADEDGRLLLANVAPELGDDLQEALL
jgi:hypothetical protein